MKSRAGPNPNRRFKMGLPPSSMGFALISTPLLIKNASRPGSTKEGTVVVKLLTVLGAGASRRIGRRSLFVLDSPPGATVLSAAVLGGLLGAALFSSVGG